MHLVSLLSPSPLFGVPTVFSDGGKMQGTIVFQNPSGSWQTLYTAGQASAQRSELAVVILAFQTFPFSTLNIIADTQYVVRMLSGFPNVYLSPSLNLIFSLSLPHPA